MKGCIALISLLMRAVMAQTKVLQGFYVDVKLDELDNDYAIIKVWMPKGTWFGLGLGTKNMKVDSDLIMVDSAARQVLDMHSVGNRMPARDASQDLQFKFDELGSDNLVVMVRRALDTSDTLDYVLPIATDFDLAWAANLKSTNIEKAHTFRGAINFKIFPAVLSGASSKVAGAAG